jgi:hypothetical protein
MERMVWRKRRRRRKVQLLVTNSLPRCLVLFLNLRGHVLVDVSGRWVRYRKGACVNEEEGGGPDLCIPALSGSASARSKPKRVITSPNSRGHGAKNKFMENIVAFLWSMHGAGFGVRG